MVAADSPAATLPQRVRQGILAQLVQVREARMGGESLKPANTLTGAVFLDVFQLADAIDPSLLVGGRKAGGKSIPAERCLARIEKHGIVRHPAEQAHKIACVDGTDPG